jgi:hypothetical protein
MTTNNINNMQKKQATDPAEGNSPSESKGGVEQLEEFMNQGEERYKEAEAQKRRANVVGEQAARDAQRLQPQARRNALQYAQALVDQRYKYTSKGCSKDQAKLDKMLQAYPSQLEELWLTRERLEVQGHELLLLYNAQAISNWRFKVLRARNARKLRAVERKMAKLLARIERAIHRVSGDKGVLEFLEGLNQHLVLLCQSQEASIMLQQSAVQQAEAVETLLQNSELATAAKSEQGRKQHNTASTPLFDQHAEQA